MKYFFLFFITLILLPVTLAQSKYLWPIKNATIGENILYRPNDYIAEEHNYDNLIITAQENNFVVAPVRGRVNFYAYSYKKKLNSGISYHLSISQYEADMNKLKNSDNWEYNTKFVCARLSIQAEDGNTVNIEGIRPVKGFKTGEYIKEGDTIGRVGYFYYKINKPSIAINISKQAKAEDPMSPFGLKSTFKKVVEYKPPTFLTQEEALTDYCLFVEALQEGYPGLYDYMNPEEWKSFVTTTILKITNPISYSSFENIIINTIHQLRDSHLNLIYKPSQISNQQPYYLPTIYPGFFNDTLIVLRAFLPNADFLGKKISKINGLTPQQFRDTITHFIVGADGFVQSYLIREKLLYSWSYFRSFADSKNEFYLCFENDSTIFFPNEKNIGKSSKNCTPIIPNWRNFFLSRQQELTFDKKSEKIGYIYIPTFYLDEMEMLRIGNFIKEITDSAYTSLIIDVRNNNGGDVERLKQLFSFIAQQPFKEAIYSKVNKIENFSFFGNTTNHVTDSYVMFPEYTPIKGKDSFINTDYQLICPDSSVNFKEKIYVLVNELSFSAAANFAALVYKYKRGVVVGRETGTAYYQMNALKFANMLLPNSNIEICIPLVKIVFDTIPSPHITWGRGVIPDYEVNFSLEELEWINGDTILNYALHLIEQDIYFKQEPITENNDNGHLTWLKKLYNIRLTICVVLSGIIILIIITIIYYSSKKK